MLVALCCMVCYVISLVSVPNPDETLGGQEPPRATAVRPGPAAVAIGVLWRAAALLAVLSEQLVGAIDPFIETFGLTPFFVGVILIPTIGNLAEHLVAVQLALKNRVDFAMAVSIGSSLQVALFVGARARAAGPRRRPADGPRVRAAGGRRGGGRGGDRALIALDGESNWLEGALLMGVYVILAVSFFEFVAPHV